MKLALKELNWPNQVKSSSDNSKALHTFKSAFEHLLLFRELPEFSSGPVISSASLSVPSLLPFRIMAVDIDIRFRYHFQSSRPTNNIEKVTRVSRRKSDFSRNGSFRAFFQRYNCISTLCRMSCSQSWTKLDWDALHWQNSSQLYFRLCNARLIRFCPSY